VRFAVSPKVLDDADAYRPPPDANQFAGRTMVGIAQAVARLTGGRPGRHVLETLLEKAGFDQQRLLDALMDLIRSGRFYSTEDLELFVTGVVGALLRRSGAG
jgi:hypothetical protein